MDEVENQSSAEMQKEVALPETEATQEVQQEVQAAVEPDQQDNAWIKKLRRNHEESKRQAQELKAQNEMLMGLLKERESPFASKPQVEEDILHELAKEDYSSGEKVVKAFQKLEAKFEKKYQALEAKQAEKAQNNMLAEVKREYSDFDEVVNPETLEILEETNPRLAATLAKTMKEDPYSFAVQSYEYIKAKGLSKTPTQAKRIQETEKKIEQNKKSVNTPQALEKRPMAQAFNMNELSDKMKEELRSEMYGNAKLAGGGY